MHTPTPWAVGSMEDGLWITGPDAKENVICDLVGRNSRYKFTAEDDANAAFIVTACNAHDALVAALTEAIQLIRIWHGEEAWDIYAKHSPEMKRLNAALALATPKEAVR